MSDTKPTRRYKKATYELVAGLLRETANMFEENAMITTVLAFLTTKFADKFHDDNPQFDVYRFHEAARATKASDTAGVTHNET